MKKLFYAALVLLTMAGSACKKDKDSSCNLPSTAVPQELVGNWVNGYTSFTQIVDAYNGKFLGTTWKSGRYMELKNNGKNVILYIMGGSQYSEFATRVEGNVTVDEEEGTIHFQACSVYYKGWQNGVLTVNRAATDSERQQITNNLEFYYGFETSGGINYLQLLFVSEPGGSPTSFRRAD